MEFLDPHPDDPARPGGFTQSFGSDELDASTLMLPIVGFLPPDHPQMAATIDAVATGLTDERGLVSGPVPTEKSVLVDTAGFAADHGIGSPNPSCAREP